jgi:hypothetical protein
VWDALDRLGFPDDGTRREAPELAARRLTEDEVAVWRGSSALMDGVSSAADGIRYFARRGLTDMARYWRCVTFDAGRVITAVWPGGEWTWGRHAVPSAYQVTHLTPDLRRDRRINVGSFGSGAVRLGEPDGRGHGMSLGLAEGLETALSVTALYGIPCWAVLGARMAAVELPAATGRAQVFGGRVHLFGDNGAPGRAAVARAVERFTAEGRAVVEHYPPEGFGDFNDLLQSMTHG